MDMTIDFQTVRGHFMMLPYAPNTGTLTDEALFHLYKRLKSEGLLELVFHEQPDISLLAFMNNFSTGRNLLQIFSIIEGNEFVDTAGLAWLSDIVNCQGLLIRGIGSFVFFKEYQKPAYTDPFAEIVLEYWFNVLKVNTVIGITPEINRAALVFIKRNGFVEVGRVPNYTTLRGEITNGVISFLTAEEFKSRKVV